MNEICYKERDAGPGSEPWKHRAASATASIPPCNEFIEMVVISVTPACNVNFLTHSFIQSK